MLKFCRALLSGLFAIAEATCCQLDDAGNSISSMRAMPTTQQKQSAANFGALRFVGLIFSQCETTNHTVSFSQWSEWLAGCSESTRGHWLSTVLDCTSK